jgi:hypothetical protein
MSWVYGKSPLMAAQVARGDRREAREIFLKASSRSLLVTAVGCVALLGLFLLVKVKGYGVSERLSSMETAMWLSAVTLVNSVVFSMATFMRAHKEEKLTAPSVVGALVLAPSLYFSSRHSVDAMAATYCLLSTAIAVPWSLWHFRRRWTMQT